MSLGYSYTMAPSDTAAPPALTGHALTRAAAYSIVERLLSADDTLFCGIVRDLASPVPVAARCRRSRQPGQFIWSPVMIPLALSAAG